MDTKIKNYLGYAGVAVILVFAYASLSYVSTYSKAIEPSSFRSFSVNGEGKSVIVPDVAQFTFSVITEGGNDVADLQAQNSEKSNKIIAFLKDSGVHEKDIKTVNYSVEPRQEYYSCPPVYLMETGAASSPRPCPPPKIAGYTIRRTDQVKIRDFKKIGEVLSGVVTNGGNEVSQLYFTIDDPDKVQSEARVEAIQKAKEKAAAIARAGGFKLGRLLNISEGGYYPGVPIYSRGLAEKGGYGGDTTVISPEIQPGSEEVSVTVTMVFEIK